MNKKKLLQLCLKYLLSFFVVVFLSFLLPRLIPGSPLYTLTGEGSGFADGVPSAVLGQFEEYYSPELPLSEQFLRYLSHLSKFDLGNSFYYKTPVLDRILGGAKWTLLISGTALFISTSLGTLLGVAMGLAKKNRGAVWMPPLLAVQSIPTFLLAAAAQIRFHFIIKNILPEMLGKLNIQAILCIMGSMFVEAVFSYPGLGQLLKNATNYRDYPLMQGILLISCLYGIGINLIFEVLLAKNTKIS